MVAAVGIVVAIAIPFINEYRHADDVSAIVGEALGKSVPLQERVTKFVQQNGRLPLTAGELEPGGAGKPPPGGMESGKPLAEVELMRSGDTRVAAALGARGVVSVHFERLALHEGTRSIVLVPQLKGSELTWSCENRDIKGRFLPPTCRKS
jgi:hypothetical protein